MIEHLIYIAGVGVVLFDFDDIVVSVDFGGDNWWGGFDWQTFSSLVGSQIGLMIWSQSKGLHSLLFGGFHKLFLLPWEKASEEVFIFLYWDPHA